MQLADLFYTEVIPVGLWIVMFGMGLSLTPKDIRNVFATPKALSVGLTGQLVLLPLLAFAIAVLLAPTPAIAVGAVILASCPGGVTSNAYSFASRADVALSVSLTAVTSFVTIFSVPLLTYFALLFFVDEGVRPELPVAEMVYTLAKLTVIPVAIGMIVRYLWSERTRRLIEGLRMATFLFLLALITAGTIVSFDVLKEHFAQTAVVAVSLNVLAMCMGFVLGRIFRLSVPQRISITYEVGVQNITLSAVVVLSLLGNEEFFVVTLVYAVIMKLTALTFMYFARRWLVSEERAPSEAAPRVTVEGRS
ncbi:MAG: bile acid:sodium symporter family protein [Haliea sp.]